MPPLTLDPLFYNDHVLVFKIPKPPQSRTRAVVPVGETTFVRAVMVGEETHAFYRLENFCCLLLAIFDATGVRIA